MFFVTFGPTLGTWELWELGELGDRRDVPYVFRDFWPHPKTVSSPRADPKPAHFPPNSFFFWSLTPHQ
jgi:hypothetical protein